MIETQAFKDANDLVSHVDAALSNHMLEISALETKFMNDLGALIDKAKCAVDLTLNQSLQNRLAA